MQNLESLHHTQSISPRFLKNILLRCCAKFILTIQPDIFKQEINTHGHKQKHWMLLNLIEDCIYFLVVVNFFSDNIENTRKLTKSGQMQFLVITPPTYQSVNELIWELDNLQ